MNEKARIKRFEALILEYGVEISSPPATTEGDDQANSRAYRVNSEKHVIAA